MSPSPSLRFSVRRGKPELVAPATPMSRELKRLSVIDDQEVHRFYIPNIFIFRRVPSVGDNDPAVVIRDALARALVFYYPFAGRIRESDDQRLFVDCNNEGVLFVEADADITLEEFGDALYPPFPCVEELIFDMDDFYTVIDTPLLFIQVTRLRGGDFVFSICLNHALADATGLVQLLNAIGELARGATQPSVIPVWHRELLEPRPTRTPSFAHREYDAVSDIKSVVFAVDGLEHRSFFFTSRQINSLRRHLPPDLGRASTTFELLSGTLWRARTLALQPADPEEEFRFIFRADARRRPSPNLSLPTGFYGNGIADLVAVATAGELCHLPLAYAVNLVKQAKSEVSVEYLRSVTDLMWTKGPLLINSSHAYFVSDITNISFGGVDFGWGKPAYGGPAHAHLGTIPGIASLYIPFVNSSGEKGIVVSISLKPPAMERFVSEMGRLFGDEAGEEKVVSGRSAL